MSNTNVDGGLANAGGPYASTVDGGNALGNVYVPPSWRWTLSDTVTGEVYTFENNPTTASPLPLQKSVNPYAVSADDGFSVFYEGADTPQIASFQITVLTESFYSALVYWYDKRRQILLTDDIGNSRWIYFTQFTPTRKWTVQHPWRHDVTMQYYVFGDQTAQGVPSPGTASPVPVPTLSGHKVVSLGDSIAYLNGGEFLWGMCARGGQQAQYLGEYAFPGQGLNYMLTAPVALPAILALTGTHKPAACVIEGGLNDITLLNQTITQMQSNLTGITQGLVGAGIVPILCTIIAQASLSEQTLSEQWNTYIRSLGAQNGWLVLDVYNALMDPNTGTYPATSSADGTHPNGVGYHILTSALAPVLKNTFYPGGAYVSQTQGDTLNILAPSLQLMSGTVVNGLAGGGAWVNASGAGSGVTFSVGTDPGIVGNYQQVSSAPGTVGSVAFDSQGVLTTTGFAPGDRLAFSCKFRCTGQEPWIGAPGDGVPSGRPYSRVGLFGYTAGYAAQTFDARFTTQSDDAAGEWRTLYGETVVPANTQNIFVFCGIDGGNATGQSTKTLQVAQPTVINLGST